MKILVIEDDEIVADALIHILTNQNYAVEVAADGRTGWNLVEAFDYDLILLDVVLPKIDGISLCRHIRSAGVQTPILLLTGCGNGHDKAVGLDAGADDYVVKPFDQEELVARIRALLRRGTATGQPALHWGHLTLDPCSCEVVYNTKLLSLTPKEYALLELFLRNSRRVFSCGMILEHLWSYEEVPGEEAVRTHIKGLRQKLKAAGCPADLIETVYGIGYRLKPQESIADPAVVEPTKAGVPSAGTSSVLGQVPETSSHVSSQPLSQASPLASQASPLASQASPPGFAQSQASAHATAPVQQSSRSKSKVATFDRQAAVPQELDETDAAPKSASRPQQTLLLIDKVWQRYKDRINGQIDVLEQTANILIHQRSLERALHQQAKHHAHTLAGSLGTFGLAVGSQLARQIESVLQTDGTLSPVESEHLQQWVFALRREVEQATRRSQGQVGGESLGEFSSESIEKDDRPLVLVIDRDRALAETLVIEASLRGLRTDVAVNLTQARHKIYLEAPQIVLLDPAVSPHLADCQLLLRELQKQAPPVPVVMLTEHADLADRLMALRLGGRAFVQKSTGQKSTGQKSTEPNPTQAGQVLEVVMEVLEQAEQLKDKVLVVDDDPSILTTVRHLLEPWGLRVITLDDPQRFWTVLEAIAPHLLILDIEMPHVSGIELSQIVRSDAKWGDLPILILTAHTDTETVNQVFSIGADDFVSKPIVGPELVTRTVNRLERTKLLKRRYAQGSANH